MNLNAPIIIIPEECVLYYAIVVSFSLDSSITTKKCTHLVIDAGQISIVSELANKKAIQEIQAKRKQQYTDEDYKHLEAMMYDKLLVKLQSAQVSRTRCPVDLCSTFQVLDWQRPRFMPACTYCKRRRQFASLRTHQS